MEKYKKAKEKGVPFFPDIIFKDTVVSLIILGIFWYVMTYTRWGLEMRAVGGNPQAARRNGIPWARYLILAMCIGGAIAAALRNAGVKQVINLSGGIDWWSTFVDPDMPRY